MRLPLSGLSRSPSSLMRYERTLSEGNLRAEPEET